MTTVAGTPLTVESYADLKVPETISADTTLVDGFKSLAVKQGIPPESAQALLDYYTEVQTAVQKSTLETWTSTQAQWTAAVDAMPEFQGDRRAQSLNLLGQAIDEFGDASVREAMNMSGLGNHPGLVKMIYSMARALTEDAPAPLGKPAGQSSARKTPAEIMYGPTDKPN